ncbi:hypothetical protein SAMN04487952_10952 [Halomonas caseinilytica]|nr:hypothetical protein SAMN04487952_10952 [Halomonas caseinilytica]
MSRQTANPLSTRFRGLVRRCGDSEHIAIESATPEAAFELQRRGYRVLDAQEPLELARAFKVPNEIKMVRSSWRVVEEA